MKFQQIYCHSLNTPYDFLDSGSIVLDGIISLNDHILFYELIFSVIVCWMLFYVLFNNSPFTLKDIKHGSVIEIIWTIVPGLVLILIAIPSFRLLYLMDDMLEPTLTIKVIGNQWYWSYAFGDESFEAYLLQDNTPGTFRMLDTDNHLILPSNTYIRFLITATDVLHSFGIPALGVKTDAVPGRINQTGIEIYRPGLYFGQCYELCGIGHGQMPITIKVI